MTNKFFKIILIVILLLIIALQQGRLVGREFPIDEDDTATVVLPEISLNKARLIFPETSFIERVDTSLVEVLDNQRERIGILMLTSPYTDNISGFGGPVPLLIGFDNEKRVRGVIIEKNRETPEYLDRVLSSGLLSEWDGLERDAALSKKVDAVSGATFTSEAVVKTFQKRIAMDSPLNVGSKLSWSILIKNVVVISILLLALYSFFYPATGKKLRLPLLILSVALLGFWQGAMFSLSQFMSWLINGIPLGVQFGLLLVFIVSVLLPLFTRRSFYCSYVCPFGAAQELVGKIDRKKIKISPKVLQYLLVVRKAYLIAIVLLLAMGVNFNLSYVEPFSVFNINIASMVTIGIALVSLFLSLFINRPWCRFLCPVGQIFDLLRK
jgi:Na+-translocating ferredoxin:NAD+ oxidoreductase RnfG subunit